MPTLQCANNRIVAGCQTKTPKQLFAERHYVRSDEPSALRVVLDGHAAGTGPDAAQRTSDARMSHCSSANVTPQFQHRHAPRRWKVCEPAPMPAAARHRAETAIRTDSRLLLQASRNPPSVFDKRRLRDLHVRRQGKDNPVQHLRKSITNNSHPRPTSTDFEADPFKMFADSGPTCPPKPWRRRKPEEGSAWP